MKIAMNPFKENVFNAPQYTTFKLIEFDLKNVL